jgi:hypothetical protein
MSVGKTSVGKMSVRQNVFRQNVFRQSVFRQSVRVPQFYYIGKKSISAVIILIYIYHLHIEMDYFLFVWMKSLIFLAAIWRRTMQNDLSTKRDR